MMTEEHIKEVLKDFADLVHAHRMFLLGVSDQDRLLPQEDLEYLVDKVRNANVVRFV